ncbi:MAG: hypothetical protein ACREDT_10155 [Methylocella sp.]
MKHPISQTRLRPAAQGQVKLREKCGAFTTFVANFWRADFTGSNHGKT